MSEQPPTSTTPTPAAAPVAPRAPLSDKELAWLLRSLLCFGLVAASLVAYFNEVFALDLNRLVEANALATRLRYRLIDELGVALALGMAAPLVWFLRHRKDGLRKLDTVARFFAPLLLIGFLPPLLTRWSNPLQLSLTLGAFLLLFEPLARLHFASYSELPALDRAAAALHARLTLLALRWPRLARDAGLYTVMTFALVYMVYTSVHTIYNHWRFNTFNYDLGQLDNLFYNALHGHPMRCTPLIKEGNWSELRNHAELSTFFLLPFYAIAPRAETLLVLQSCIIGSGAIPIYRFASRRLSRKAALLLAVAYLFYAPMNEANYFDFHYQPVAAGFILWMLDLFDDGHSILFGLLYIVAIGCREDISVGLAVFGIFLMLSGTRVRWGLGIAAVSAIYFVVLRFIVMPSFGQWGFQDIYRELFPLGDNSFRGVITTLVTNPVFTFKTMLTPEKLRYSLQILLPVAFLPLRRPLLWLALLPGIFFTVLTTQYQATTEISFQYSGHFTAYIFPAAALALAAYGADAVRRRAALVAVLLGTLLTAVHWGAFPLRSGVRAGFATVNADPPTPFHLQKLRDLAALVAMVPPEAALASSDRELPHVSNRINCYTLMDGYEGADYILYVPHTGGRDEPQAQRALDSGEYEQVASRGELSLLKRKGAPGPLLPARPEREERRR